MVEKVSKNKKLVLASDMLNEMLDFVKKSPKNLLFFSIKLGLSILSIKFSFAVFI